MNPLFIGISGGTGSGKTYLSNLLIKYYGLQSATKINLDSYYKNLSGLNFEERQALNYDHPNSIDIDLFTNHLTQLINGEKIEVPTYSFSKHLRTNKTTQIEPRKIVIIEGLLVLHFMEIYNFLNLKIYVDAPNDIRFIRRLKRDMVERNRSLESVISQYLKTVRPMHEKYVLPSKQIADLIVSNQKNLNSTLQKIKIIIEKKL